MSLNRLIWLIIIYLYWINFQIKAELTLLPYE